MKEEEIRPADLLDTYFSLCAEDARTYFGSCDRKPVPCPACGDRNPKPGFEKWGFEYAECSVCGTLYQTPRPPREQFDQFYCESPSSEYWAKTFFPTVAEARREKLFRPKVKQIAELCADDDFKPEVVADIGAGYGIFLEEWKNRFPDSKAVAVEPNHELADVCRGRKLDVAECFAEEAPEVMGLADLVIAFEVIEHVYDPLHFCTSLAAMVRPGGRALVTSLSVDGFDIRALWQESRNIYPPSHINILSIDGFERLMKRAGFSRISISTPGKLDVDIVKNVYEKNPDALSGNSFVRHLLTRDEETLSSFQTFLSRNRLSSHCWVWAEK